MISVVTATLNAASSLPRLAESLRRQTCTDFEWIVIDGASTDGTEDALSHFADINPRFTSQTDFGVYDALNRGLRLAAGEYYLVVGADDLLAPDAIERYQAVATATQADLIVFNLIENGKVIDYTLGKSIELRQRSFAAHSVGTLIRKKLHDVHGYYSPRFPIASDRHFLEKVKQSGAKIHFEPHVAGEFGTTGLSSRDRLGALTESFRVAVDTGGNKAFELVVFLLRLLWNFRKL